jgi:hypothetical protein
MKHAPIALLFALVLVLPSGSAGAQATVRQQGADTVPAMTVTQLFEARQQGRQAANAQSTAPYFLGGFLGGLTIYFSPVPLVAAAMTSVDPDLYTEMMVAEKHPQYQAQFADEYRSRLRSRRLTSAGTGVLAGVATLVGAIFIGLASTSGG